MSRSVKLFFCFLFLLNSCDSGSTKRMLNSNNEALPENISEKKSDIKIEIIGPDSYLLNEQNPKQKIELKVYGEKRRLIENPEIKWLIDLPENMKAQDGGVFTAIKFSDSVKVRAQYKDAISKEITFNMAKYREELRVKPIRAQGRPLGDNNEILNSAGNIVLSYDLILEDAELKSGDYVELELDGMFIPVKVLRIEQGQVSKTLVLERVYLTDFYEELHYESSISETEIEESPNPFYLKDFGIFKCQEIKAGAKAEFKLNKFKNDSRFNIKTTNTRSDYNLKLDISERRLKRFDVVYKGKLLLDYEISYQIGFEKLSAAVTCNSAEIKQPILIGCYWGLCVDAILKSSLAFSLEAALESKNFSVSLPEISNSYDYHFAINYDPDSKKFNKISRFEKVRTKQNTSGLKLNTQLSSSLKSSLNYAFDLNFSFMRSPLDFAINLITLELGLEAELKKSILEEYVFPENYYEFAFKLTSGLAAKNEFSLPGLSALSQKMSDILKIKKINSGDIGFELNYEYWKKEYPLFESLKYGLFLNKNRVLEYSENLNMILNLNDGALIENIPIDLRLWIKEKSSNGFMDLNYPFDYSKVGLSEIILESSVLKKYASKDPAICSELDLYVSGKGSYLNLKSRSEIKNIKIAPACNTEEIFCDDDASCGCVNLKKNMNHCGECSKKCEDGEYCKDGVCEIDNDCPKDKNGFHRCTKSCSINNGEGVQIWNKNTDSFGICKVNVCDRGYYRNPIKNKCLLKDMADKVIKEPEEVAAKNNSEGGELLCPAGYHLGDSYSPYYSSEGDLICEEDTQECKVENGIGKKSWDYQLEYFTECSASICNEGFHIQGGMCVENVQECSLSNGKGFKYWDGGRFSSCYPDSCDCGYVIDDSGRSCKKQEFSKELVKSGWVKVKAGCFLMGYPEGEMAGLAGGLDSSREVEITRDFFIMDHEFTQAEWKALGLKNPSYFSDPNPSQAESRSKSCNGFCPVDSVNFYEAIRAANELSKIAGLDQCYKLSNCNGNFGKACSNASNSAGLDCDGISCDYSVSEDFNFDGEISFKDIFECPGFRLPSSAEWEYAYRAGSLTAFYNGDPSPMAKNSKTLFSEDANLNSIAWYAEDNEKSTLKEYNYSSRPMKLKLANAYGIYDMAGNVSEWVMAIPHNSAYSDKKDRWVDPICDKESDCGLKDYSMIRNCGWFGLPDFCRAAHVFHRFKTMKSYQLGFRLVRTAEDLESLTITNCKRGERPNKRQAACLPLKDSGIELRKCAGDYASSYIDIAYGLNLSPETYCGDIARRFSQKRNQSYNHYVYDWLLRGYWSRISSSKRKWKNSSSYCKSLGKNWELPDIYQLRSLLSEDENWRTQGHISKFFADTDRRFFWSSSDLGENSLDALGFDFAYGATYEEPKDSDAYIRCFKSSDY